MKKKLITICIMTAAVVFSAGNSASATLNTIEMAYLAVDAGGQQGMVLYGQAHNGANGLMAMKTRNPIGELAQQIPSHTWAYCYDATQYSDFAFATFTVKTLGQAIGSDKGDIISQLWAQYYNNAWQGDTYIYYGGFIGGQPANTPENQQALAFSFAVYEIFYDFNGGLSSLNLSTGSLLATSAGTNPSAAIGIAQTWLNSLVLPVDYLGPKAQLVSISNCSLQDVIVEIPEPATITLLTMGFLTLIGKKK